MTEPIGKVGDSQTTAAARINLPSDVAFGAFEKLPTRAHENLPICSVINS